MRLTIFPIYYSGASAPTYQSDCYRPIMASSDPHWAELTAHEQVLNKYLPTHPEEQYLGFCHYRCFFDFWRAFPSRYLPHRGFAKFHREFKGKYTEARILPIIENYDVVVPMPSRWSRRWRSVRENYLAHHPRIELERLEAIIRRDYPEMVSDMEVYLDGRCSRQCLNFIMRRDWFEEYLRWELDILKKLERECDWSLKEYQTHNAIRVPAFLAERFFNVFVNWKLRTTQGRLLERQLVLLVPDEETRPLFILKRYLQFIFDLIRG